MEKSTVNNFKKLFLGALFTAILLLAAPVQEAQAAGVTLTSPSKQFFYGKNSEWFYYPPLGGTQLFSSNTQGVNENISYIQFDVTNTIFGNPSVKVNASLSMFLNSVGVITDGAPSNDDEVTLSVYRVNDEAVYNASGHIPNTGQNAPIALDELLATNTYRAFVNEEITFDFTEQINSTIVEDSSYVSFAIVAGVVDATTNFTTGLAGSQSLFMTPVPEPMSLSYMLLGCLVFAFRRIKKTVLGIFGLE